MARAEVLQAIDALTARECGKCTDKDDYAAKGIRIERVIATVCNVSCPVGAQLRELGNQLGRKADKPMSAPRQRRREWVHDIQRKGPNYGAALYEETEAGGRP